MPRRASNTTNSTVGALPRTAAMISAPSTLTPMNATTRPMPQVTVTESCRRQGRMKPSRERMVSGQPTCVASCARSRTTAPVSCVSGAGMSGSVAGAMGSLRSASCGPIRRRYGPSRAISSAWLPLCTTVPLSNTRMRSAPITLDRRCARISVVRPTISRSSACWITASFSASTEDRASSSTRMGASRSSARAMAMRCR